MKGGAAEDVFYGIDFKNEEWENGQELPKLLGWFRLSLSQQQKIVVRGMLG